ncbi:DHA1 family multidrug resistance protein-like MFS transporter [Chitinivorax tropicus]|uniref:DHA1 family multidrug resistance protein-like MFS transporter n=1 Tax=Chitinivorax tropicus TaxID=714531 RepID=A0A840MM00_9PROT|nr:MFS transporter [Chitinivorax tropicus]MBB5017937.1 DHA1 family multidrug resistance protein-like MFS transporter [Chitinivorax tropicus]
MSEERTSLSDQIRRRGLYALLVYTFFMVIGFAMLMPLVAVHFVSDVGMAAALVGTALAIRQLTQQGLAIVGGVLSDRFGARPMICLGVLLRALGFVSLAFADNVPLLFVAMVLSALGGALFEAPYQASIAALTTEETRSRYYAISNWVSGVATTIGPLVGVALLRFDFQWVCLAAAACFALNFLIALLLPTITTESKPRPLSHGLSLVRHDLPFMMLTGLMMGYWFTAVQMNISFPLMAEHLAGSADGVGVMFAVSAGLTVTLQYPLVRLFERWLSTPQILMLGMTVMALGTGAIALAQGFVSFLLCVAMVAIGAILARPTMQSLIASMANPQALGTFLGVSSLSLAIGGAIGNVTGGWLIDFASARQLPHLPWLIYCCVGLLSTYGLFLLLRTQPAARHVGEQVANP